MEAKKSERLYGVNKDAANFWYKSGANSEEAIRYLSARKITDDTRKKFGVGFAEDDKKLFNHLIKLGYSEDEMVESGLFLRDQNDGDLHCRFYRRIMIPIQDKEGNILAFGGRRLESSDGGKKERAKYINTATTPIYKKSENLFCLNHVKDGKPLVLCEGYFDVISLQQAGVNGAVASLGTALTKWQAKKIYEHHTTGGRQHVAFIAYDSDEAGQKATVKAIDLLREEGCICFVVSSSPYKDFDEAAKTETVDQLTDRFRQARLDREWLVSYLFDKLDEAEACKAIALRRWLLTAPQ